MNKCIKTITILGCLLGISQPVDAARPLAWSDNLFPNVYYSREGAIIKKSPYILNGRRIYKTDFKCGYSRYCSWKGGNVGVIHKQEVYDKLPDKPPWYFCSSYPQDWKYLRVCAARD